MIPDDLAQPQLTFWLHMVNRVSFLDEKPLGLGVAIIPSGLRHIAILRVFKPLSDSDAIADIYLANRRGEPCCATVEPRSLNGRGAPWQLPLHSAP